MRPSSQIILLLLILSDYPALCCSCCHASRVLIGLFSFVPIMQQLFHVAFFTPLGFTTFWLIRVVEILRVCRSPLICNHHSTLLPVLVSLLLASYFCPSHAFLVGFICPTWLDVEPEWHSALPPTLLLPCSCLWRQRDLVFVLFIISISPSSCCFLSVTTFLYISVSTVLQYLPRVLPSHLLTSLLLLVSGLMLRFQLIICRFVLWVSFCGAIVYSSASLLLNELHFCIHSLCCQRLQVHCTNSYPVNIPSLCLPQYVSNTRQLRVLILVLSTVAPDLPFILPPCDRIYSFACNCDPFLFRLHTPFKDPWLFHMYVLSIDCCFTAFLSLCLLDFISWRHFDNLQHHLRISVFTVPMFFSCFRIPTRQQRFQSY